MPRRSIESKQMIFDRGHFGLTEELFLSNVRHAVKSSRGMLRKSVHTTLIKFEWPVQVLGLQSHDMRKNICVGGGVQPDKR